MEKQSGNEGQDYKGTIVMIPCLNEEKTVGKVVADFKAALPGAKIFVYDNNSTDKTAEIARSEGAVVVPAPIQGKGNVVRQMFAELDGDVFLMVDGDDTYPADQAPGLIAELKKGAADMVVGARLSAYEAKSFRAFHKFGNRLVAGLISLIFSRKVTDVMSGYRVFSWTFVKSIPLMSEGFDVETEMTLQALAKDFRITEIPIKYGERPAGSFSKLNTYMDGFLVLKTIFLIFKDYKPFIFFFLLSLMLAGLSIAIGYWPIMDYIKFRYVYHVPLAVLASGIGILSALSFGLGLIMDTLAKYHNENFVLRKRLVTKRLNRGDEQDSGNW
ncbi:MAG: glycosyltransferase family 2 protein [Nitrospirota bacterium]